MLTITARASKNGNLLSQKVSLSYVTPLKNALRQHCRGCTWCWMKFLDGRNCKILSWWLHLHHTHFAKATIHPFWIVSRRNHEVPWFSEQRNPDRKLVGSDLSHGNVSFQRIHFMAALWRVYAFVLCNVSLMWALKQRSTRRTTRMMQMFLVTMSLRSIITSSAV
jgi:hypothetical protein